MYCDVNGINSIYNQLFSNAEEVLITDKKSRELAGKVELPYILQGFFGTNLSGEYTRDYGTEKSTRVTITIEDKIRSILDYLKYDTSKKIDMWSDNGRLVAGYATIIDYERFSERISELFKSSKEVAYSNFESFLDSIRYDPEFESLWLEFIEFARNAGVFENRGTLLKIMDGFAPENRDKGTILKSIAVDLKYPVILHYSTNKLLLSHSDAANASLICSRPKTCILGILQKADVNLYTIKPLAMWHDISYERNTRLIDGALDYLHLKRDDFLW